MKSTTAFKAIGLALFTAASSAFAVNFSFTGNLANDNDVQLFTFSVGATSNVTLRTWSYAGGTNAAGTLIARGGFDPILALFNSAGTLIGQNDDGGSSLVAIDAVTGQAWDTFLNLPSLAPGTYTVSVAQYANFALGPNLSNGFSGSGTTGWRDNTGNVRNSSWAFDILNVDQAVVQRAPDAGSSLALFTLALVGLVGLRRKFQTS
ncbi:DVUA0089 family protein [Horticoccus sp. 23ND18S-11]|uniref:DVUA0089 family protein n=1 Tax=Horticoccus sp. 23ND18S-11 TaxID=3391832 RepID=UPI0039C8F34F